MKILVIKLFFKIIIHVNFPPHLFHVLDSKCELCVTVVPFFIFKGSTNWYKHSVCACVFVSIFLGISRNTVRSASCLSLSFTLSVTPPPGQKNKKVVRFFFSFRPGATGLQQEFLILSIML